MNFSLKVLLIGMTLVACLTGAMVIGEFIGLVVGLCLCTGAYIVVAPSSATWVDRLGIILMGIGAAFVGWTFAFAMAGSQTLGFSWFTARADYLGGWGSGMFVAAWRASHVFLTKPVPTDLTDV